MSDMVSGLVQPVVGGKVDMAMVEYSDKVWLGQAGRVFFYWHVHFNSLLKTHMKLSTC